VDNLRKTLLKNSIACQYLEISRPFHSPMMEAASAALTKKAQAIKLNPPEIPYLSNLTGTWITDEQAVDPGYWAGHLCQTVKFDQGIQELFKKPDQILLELGPDQTLGLLLEMHPNKTDGQLVLSSMNNPQDKEKKRPDPEFLFSAAGQLWVAGVKIDWSEFYTDAQYQPVVLPNYAWQRQRYWISASTHKTAGEEVLHPLLGRQLSLAAHQTSAICFESQLTLNSPEYLKDHCVFGTPVMPMAVFMEMALAAGSIYFESESFEIKEAFIQQALILQEGDIKNIQLFLVKDNSRNKDVNDAADKTQCEFEIFSSTIDDQTNKPAWILHASGIINEKKSDTDKVPVDLKALQSRCITEVFPEVFYERLQNNGLGYGPMFQAIQQAWTSGKGESLGKLKLADELLSDWDDYHLHPVLLDASWQTTALALTVETNETYVPLNIGYMRFYQSPEPDMWCYARAAQDNESGQITLKIEKIQLFTTDGQLVADVRNFLLKKIDIATILPGRFDKWKNWLYEVNWIPQEKKSDESLIISKPGHWLIFADQQGIGQNLAELLKKRSHVCTLVFRGETYEQINGYEFKVNPQNPDDFEKLFTQLNQGAGKESAELPVRSIVHLWSADASATEKMTLEDLNIATSNGCLSVLHLTQTLLKAEFPKFPALWLVTQNSQAVDPDPDDNNDSAAKDKNSNLSISQSPLWGMGRVISLEYPELLAGMIDLDCGESADVVTDLFDEIKSPDTENHIAFRDGQRFVARLEQAQAPTVTETKEETVTIESAATYLITGGLGGLGLKVAQWLVDQGAEHLVLIGRRGIADKNETAKEFVAQMQKQGVEIVVAKTDVANQAAMTEMMEMIRASLPPLKGVVHTAGLIDDGILQQLSRDRFTKVMAPKVEGAWNLHILTQECSLDFFVCFSSMTSLLGGHGQANYAAANAFMDTLAHYRKASGLPATSINWGPWAEVGITAGLLDAASQARMSRVIKFITPDQGLQIMEQILSMNITQVGAMSVNWSSFMQQFPANKTPSLFSVQAQVKTRPKKRSDILQKLKTASIDEYQDILIHYLQTELAKVLRLKSSHLPDPGKRFFEMGMDSLMAMELWNMLAFDLEINFPKTLFLEIPNIEELAEYLFKKMWGQESAQESDKDTEEIENLPDFDDLDNEDLQKLLDQEFEI
jgi:NAD(P)-dependent dehydrogenase (short-subunit alcohol dehydrogenase family)/acyl carrier protein